MTLPTVSRHHSGLRIVKARAAALLLMILGALVLAGCGEPGGPSASDSPLPVPTTSPSSTAVACEAALHQINTGYPQRAVLLVEQLNTQLPDGSHVCLAEYALAAAHVQEADRIAGEAAKLSDEGDKRAAQDKARAALSIDLQNDQARAIFYGLPATTRLEERVAEWKDYGETTLGPVSVLLGRALVLAAALLLIARLLTHVIPDGRKSSPKTASTLWWLGIAMTLVGSMLLAAFTPPQIPPRDADVPTTEAFLRSLLAAGIALGGTAMTAWGAARRLRIRVAATNAGGTDKASAAHVLALLDELGASPPEGSGTTPGSRHHSVGRCSGLNPGQSRRQSAQADRFGHHRMAAVAGPC